MADRDRVIRHFQDVIEASGNNNKWRFVRVDIIEEAVELLKDQKNVLQKMWNALYAEEDRLEKELVGTDKHDDWFTVYRPWLQNGFEIGLKVIANLLEQEGDEGCA